jgi:hypothetical protein
MERHDSRRARRLFAFALVLFLTVPMHAAAQQVRLAPSTSAQIMGAALSDIANQLQQASQHRCCNTKGAIIGAAAGAAVGWWFARNTCDAGSCTGAYVKYIVVAGGVGATVGAFAHVTHGHTAGLPERRVRVAGTVTPQLRAGVVSIRF